MNSNNPHYPLAALLYKKKKNKKKPTYYINAWHKTLICVEII